MEKRNFRTEEYRTKINDLFCQKFWQFILDNPDKPWDWEWISKNPNINWEIIENNHDKDWDWYWISNNPNITWEIIENNPDKDWHWRWDIQKSKYYLGNNRK